MHAPHGSSPNNHQLPPGHIPSSGYALPAVLNHHVRHQSVGYDHGLTWRTPSVTQLGHAWKMKVVKYERKADGPFAGKLVSSGTIITIDGEDYVEYKVLAKV